MPLTMPLTLFGSLRIVGARPHPPSSVEISHAYPGDTATTLVAYSMPALRMFMPWPSIGSSRKNAPV